MPNELITLGYLSNLAGMAAAVILVVSFLKWIWNLAGREAKLAAWGTASVIVALVYANQGLFAVAGLTAIGTVVVMWILNSILVTLAAMKAYEEVVEPLTKGVE